MSYATTLVQKSKWFWLLSSQKYIFIIILFKSYIHYTRYQRDIFLLINLRKWFSNQNRNLLHFESRYSYFHFLWASGPSELGVGGRRAISPPDFGRNRSRTFSFKRPWITTCPSKFIDLPAGLLLDSLDAFDYQALFPSTIFFFLFWNYLQWKPDFTIEAKPVAIIFTKKFFMTLSRFSSTHKSILFFWDRSSKWFLLFSEEGSWENPKSLFDMYIPCLYWQAVVTSSVKKNRQN